MRRNVTVVTRGNVAPLMTERCCCHEKQRCYYRNLRLVEIADEFLKNQAQGNSLSQELPPSQVACDGVGVGRWEGFVCMRCEAAFARWLFVVVLATASGVCDG